MDGWSRPASPLDHERQRESTALARRVNAAHRGGRVFRAGVLPRMTQTLDAAIARLAALPPDEQERVGRWILDQLQDDEAWAERFGASQDVLGRLAAEARADRAAGRATELDPESL